MRHARNTYANVYCVPNFMRRARNTYTNMYCVGANTRHVEIS
jgi:hypothetical protein